MYLKVGLLCLISLMGCCVRAHEEFECTEYQLKQNDRFVPAQRVRVCGAGEYEDIPKLLRTLFGIEKPIVEKPAQYLLPPFENPASPPRFSNGFSQNVLKPYWESNDLLSYIGNKQQYAKPLGAFYYDTNQQVNDDDEFDHAIDELKQKQNNQHSDGIVDDVRAVKQSVNELKTYLKEVVNNMLTPKRNDDKRERNINIKLSVDTTFESLAKRFLQLAEDSAKNLETDELNTAISYPYVAEVEDDDKELLDASQQEKIGVDVEDDDKELLDASQQEKIGVDVEDDDKELLDASQQEKIGVDVEDDDDTEDDNESESAEYDYMKDKLINYLASLNNIEIES